MRDTTPSQEHAFHAIQDAPGVALSSLHHVGRDLGEQPLHHVQGP